jgi:5-formyltetrahydrofolate cyclo-ligase
MDRISQMNKTELRHFFKARRASLNIDEVSQRSRQINQNFIDNLLPKIYQKNSAKIFSLYLSSYNEVSTEVIAQHFSKNGIRFSYPKIVQKNHPLDFILADKLQTLKPNQFFQKIFEPVDGKKVHPDFIILPLLAFDPDLSRLGMGGGFFDRTIECLKRQNSAIITIGLGYQFQRTGEIMYTENTDQRLDFVVTEKIIFSPS